MRDVSRDTPSPYRDLGRRRNGKRNAIAVDESHLACVRGALGGCVTHWVMGVGADHPQR